MGIRSFQNKVPSQGERVFVDPASTVIGEVTLGNDSSVWPGAVVRGDMHHIVIGARTSVQDNACCTSPTTPPSTPAASR